MNYIKTLEDLLQYGAKKAGYNEKLSVSFSDKKMGCDFQCNGVFALTKKICLSLLLPVQLSSIFV